MIDTVQYVAPRPISPDYKNRTKHTSDKILKDAGCFNLCVAHTLFCPPSLPLPSKTAFCGMGPFSAPCYLPTVHKNIYTKVVCSLCLTDYMETEQRKRLLRHQWWLKLKQDPIRYAQWKEDTCQRMRKYRLKSKLIKQSFIWSEKCIHKFVWNNLTDTLEGKKMMWKWVLFCFCGITLHIYL